MSYSKKWETPIASDQKAQASIIGFLVDCFNSLETYGKTPDQIKSAAKMHLMVMNDYPLEPVKRAYLHWVKTESKMPAPAEIKAIVERNIDNPYNLSETQIAHNRVEMRRLGIVC